MILKRIVAVSCGMLSLAYPAFSQVRDIYADHVTGQQIYRQNYNTDAHEGEGENVVYKISGGILRVSQSYAEPFTLPDSRTDYQVEVDCLLGIDSQMLSKGYGHGGTTTIIFDGVTNSKEDNGLFVSYCKASPTNFYFAVGSIDGTVWTTLRHIECIDLTQEYHKVKLAVADGIYYLYCDNQLLCNLPISEGNHYFDAGSSSRKVYFENNFNYEDNHFFKIQSVVVNQLDRKAVADVTPPEIAIYTPANDGSEVAEDDQGKVMVSGKVTDDSGVAWVKLNGQDVGSLQKDGYFSSSTNLASNNLIVQACDNAGNVGSKILSLKLITSDVAHIPIIPPDHPPVFHALIIACLTYRNASDNIPQARTETERLRAVLEQQYGFLDQNVQLLTDASYDQIVTTLRAVLHHMSEQDNLLITFSGHGTYNQDKSNPVGYWITGEGTDYDHGYISSDQIKNMLSETDCKAKHILILSDACYSGAFREPNKPKFNFAERTAYNYASTKVLTSCGFEKSPATSVFMQSVIKVLSDNATIYKRQYLSDQALYANIFNSISLGASNEPNLINFGTHGNQGGDFYFILKQ
jgi:hypothetical protein